MATTKRPDRDGTHRRQFELNKKRIYASETTCGICGRPVDFSYTYPHPLSPCIDHVVPVSRGGHPSKRENLQLAHRCCNREKSDKLPAQGKSVVAKEDETISNRILPLTLDWKKYRC